MELVTWVVLIKISQILTFSSMNSPAQILNLMTMGKKTKMKRERPMIQETTKRMEDGQEKNMRNL